MSLQDVTSSFSGPARWCYRPPKTRWACAAENEVISLAHDSGDVLDEVGEAIAPISSSLVVLPPVERFRSHGTSVNGESKGNGKMPPFRIPGAMLISHLYT